MSILKRLKFRIQCNWNQQKITSSEKVMAKIISKSQINWKYKISI